jgi:multidrug efflux pump subunit AcrB
VGHAVRSDPMNYNLPGPEAQLRIDRVTAADLGINVQEIGTGVRALVDGLRIGDVRHDGDNIDLLLVRDPAYPLGPEAIAAIPIAVIDRRTGKPGIVPLATIVSPQRTDASPQIKRIGQR